MPHTDSCLCLFVCIGSVRQKFLKPEWVPSFMCTERSVQNALKATDFRVLVLELTRFMLCRRTPSVLQGRRRVLRDLKHKQLCVPGHSHCPLPCLQPVVMHLACVNMKMSMNEALAAATINAAYALGKSDTHGSLEVGKQGDLLIINSSRFVLPLAFAMCFNISYPH